ncbi:Predicted metal-dependent phosphohydrolase, HD superfamily [Chitinophaga eiseniae]|uniref:Predicted metal-dependent phosphohydrolase, HD superfamily n=1 Tax=Chitinophaga eiseniae TaxID=634771 RepID=A0A1T4TJM5_9BACT|nr:hypothetical protein [Chitinophaga eiseniae]SKA40508.1 Predicted metal-dependent phosphohydrolase, HD superfamily [Chitinophaga eiseniae]
MSIPVISESWARLNHAYTANTALVQKALTDILTAYQAPGRHYHNLQHITQLLTLHHTYAGQLKAPDTVLYAIFFHDIVYDVQQRDNEQQSALAAGEYLRQTGFPTADINAVEEFIVATQTHVNTLQHSDLDYFLDFDLQILGTPPDNYQAYAQQIRQEYSIYPDNLYHPGRKKVLQHFMEMPAIYRTPAFQQQYETQARQNIQAEIDHL